MTQELSNDDKAKVFAMYWSAPCMFGNPIRYGTIGALSIQRIDKQYCQLLLTPLEDITDEGCVELLKIMSDIETNPASTASYVREWILSYAQNWKAYQYLISKAYAVPLWFGINHPANGKTAIELGIAIAKNK